MSSDDVYSDEMGGFQDMNERDIKRLFAGHEPSNDSKVGEVAEFFEDFAHAYPQVSTVHCEAAHVSAMVAAAQLLADADEPLARAAAKADGPAKQASGLPKPKRGIFARVSHVRLAVKVAVPLAALFVAFSGVAAAGALPDPVQHAVSKAADAIGISLPDPDDAALPPADDGTVDHADDAALDNGDDTAVDEGDDGTADDQDDAAVDEANDGPSDNKDDKAPGHADDADVDKTDDTADKNPDHGTADTAEKGTAHHVDEGDATGGDGQD